MLKARPGAIYGSSGIGTTGHRERELPEPCRRAGRARAPSWRWRSFTALIAGETQFTHDIPSLLKPFHEAGQAKVCSSTRRVRRCCRMCRRRPGGAARLQGLFLVWDLRPGELRAIVTRMAAAIEQRCPTWRCRRASMKWARADVGWTRSASAATSRMRWWLMPLVHSGARVSKSSEAGRGGVLSRPSAPCRDVA